MPIAEGGALSPRNAAVGINYPHRNFGSPPSAKHKPHHSCKSSSNAFGHVDLLRRVGDGVRATPTFEASSPETRW